MVSIDRSGSLRFPATRPSWEGNQARRLVIHLTTPPSWCTICSYRPASLRPGFPFGPNHPKIQPNELPGWLVSHNSAASDTITAKQWPTSETTFASPDDRLDSPKLIQDSYTYGNARMATPGISAVRRRRASGSPVNTARGPATARTSASSSASTVAEIFSVATQEMIQLSDTVETRATDR